MCFLGDRTSKKIGKVALTLYKVHSTSYKVQGTMYEYDVHTGAAQLARALGASMMISSLRSAVRVRVCACCSPTGLGTKAQKEETGQTERVVEDR